MDKRSNADNHNLCHFSYADGRRCRMLRHRDHPGLCAYHSREERQRIESERIGTELATTLTDHFYTATDVNHVLGKVFTALAQDRISIKKARVLAYLAQLMLQSIPTVKDETKFKYTYESWSKMIDNATPLPDPLDPITNEYADSATTSWDRDSLDGTCSASERSGDLTSPSAFPAPNVGARFSASQSAGGDDAARDPHSPNGADATSGDVNVAPTFKSASSGPNADEFVDHENEETETDPALISAGSNTRRGS